MGHATIEVACSFFCCSNVLVCYEREAKATVGGAWGMLMHVNTPICRSGFSHTHVRPCTSRTKVLRFLFFGTALLAIPLRIHIAKQSERGRSFLPERKGRVTRNRDPDPLQRGPPPKKAQDQHNINMIISTLHQHSINMITST